MMQLFVKTLTGRCFTIDVVASDTLAAVRQKIRDIEGTPTFRQVVIFNGKVLPEHRTLAELEVLPESTLHMVTRMRGRETVKTVIEEGHLLPTILKFFGDPTTIVQVVDAVGTIDYTVHPEQCAQEFEVHLSRPAVGEIFIRTAGGARESAAADTPLIPVTVGFPDDDDVRECGAAEMRFPFHSGNTAVEVMTNLFEVVSSILSDELRQREFDLFLTRPSGEDVRIDDVAVLIAPENATRTLRMQFLPPGSVSAFRLNNCCDSDSDADDG